MPFPTRNDPHPAQQPGSVHPFTDASGAKLKARSGSHGQPRWIIGPNRIHDWWISEWHARFPDAEIYLASRIREQAGDRINFDTLALDRETG
jgi:hypothetical protein